MGHDPARLSRLYGRIGHTLSGLTPLSKLTPTHSSEIIFSCSTIVMSVQNRDGLFQRPTSSDGCLMSRRSVLTMRNIDDGLRPVDVRVVYHILAARLLLDYCGPIT